MQMGPECAGLSSRRVCGRRQLVCKQIEAWNLGLLGVLLKYMEPPVVWGFRHRGDFFAFFCPISNYSLDEPIFVD